MQYNIENGRSVFHFTCRERLRFQSHLTSLCWNCSHHSVFAEDFGQREDALACLAQTLEVSDREPVNDEVH